MFSFKKWFRRVNGYHNENYLLWKKEVSQRTYDIFPWKLKKTHTGNNILPMNFRIPKISKRINNS